MEFRKVLALRGPNLWANYPVLEAWVDLKELEESPSDSIPGFNERLMAWLPTMIEHRCSVGERGGFFERLRRGTWMGHILEHVTLELQSLAGTPVGFGRARETSEVGVYKVAIEYKEEELARAALKTGLRAVPGRGSRPAVRHCGGSAKTARAGPEDLPGPQHRRDRGSGPASRHSDSPAEYREPGAIWLRRPPASHPGRRDRPHPAIAESDRPRQGTDPHAAAHGRRAGARRPAR